MLEESWKEDEPGGGGGILIVERRSQHGQERQQRHRRARHFSTRRQRQTQGDPEYAEYFLLDNCWRGQGVVVTVEGKGGRI